MKKFLHLSLIAILFFAINSCKKNDAPANNDPVVPFETGKTITTVVAGKVTDQTGAALNNVQITIGTTTVTTDANGSFIIPKATLGEKCGFIKATKEGYFAGSRTIIPKEKVINNVVIQLIKKTTSGSFTNSSGGTITVATGGSIVFPANAIALKNGGTYTGTVKVSAYFLDPTSNNCYKEMPGDLRGINASNNEQVLTSYGMMAVELQGSNGEALQLATGKTATLTFPIVAATQSKAPSTIPLWFFDETKGMWVEQGTATKTGNTYVGSVSHFTWWNCDWGGGPLQLTATFVDQNGNPLNNYHVYFITSAGWGGGGGHGYTASNGSITGNIPANESIIIKVESNSYCGNSYTVLYTATVGPFTQNTNLGNITVNLASQTPTTVTIKGTMVDCNNNPVTNGIATIHFNNLSYYAYVTNGLFSITNTYCTTVPTGTSTIDVFDLTTLKQNTTPAAVNVTGGGTFNVGQVAACGVQNFVHYTASFIDQNGSPLPYFYIVFTGDSTTTNYSQSSTIDAIVQANKILTRKVYLYVSCSNSYVLIDSTQIGPFTSDFNAGTITVTVPQPNTFTISGTVTDCSNNPLTNGHTTIVVDGATYFTTISNGSFSQQISRCNTTVTTANIIVVDNTTHQQNAAPISVSVSNTNVNIGTVQACGLNLTEFLNYTFDGVTYSGDSLQAYQQNLTYISGFSTSPNYTSFNSNFNGLGIGTFKLNVNLQSATGTYITSNNISSASVSVTITEYGNTGQYIAGTFTGNLLISGTTNTKPITGSFRIKRSF